MIINKLYVFEKKIELLSGLKLYTKICIEFLNQTISLLTTNKIYETTTFKAKFKQTKSALSGCIVNIIHLQALM